MKLVSILLQTFFRCPVWIASHWTSNTIYFTNSRRLRDNSILMAVAISLTQSGWVLLRVSTQSSLVLHNYCISTTYLPLWNNSILIVMAIRITQSGWALYDYSGRALTQSGCGALYDSILLALAITITQSGLVLLGASNLWFHSRGCGN